MRLLFLGDVVGQGGCEFLMKRLPDYKRKNNIDVCIANGENSAQVGCYTIVYKDKIEMVEQAIADGHMQYQTQTFDQALLHLYQTEQISYETAINAATNPDDFDLKVRGISGTSERGWM